MRSFAVSASLSVKLNGAMVARPSTRLLFPCQQRLFRRRLVLYEGKGELEHSAEPSDTLHRPGWFCPFGFTYTLLLGAFLYVG
jgi:hypothetical protein